MVVPHEAGMLALAFLLIGHEMTPKTQRRCRERLSASIKRMRRARKAGPFAGSPAKLRNAEEAVRTICRACARCGGV